MRAYWAAFFCALVIGSLATVSRVSGAEDKKTPAATAKQPDPAKLADLASRLEQLEDEPVNVELKSGATMARSKLLSITRDGTNGPPKTLQLKDADTGRTLSVNFNSIRSLSIEREKVYEASSVGAPRTAAEAKADRDAKLAAEERAKWSARAVKNGVKIWPELTNEQHNDAIEENREQIAEIKETFPDVELYETHEFMFCSNMPRDQVIPYASSLDKMHDMMCNMYGIKKGTPVWRGKCLVVAFLRASQFHQFEAKFFHKQIPDNVYGLCHQASNGRVVIACFRGDNPNDFGQMLVHETSHGFIFRYRTLARMPSWVNEGMADWIGQALVPASTSTQRGEAMALQVVRQSGSLQGLFDAAPIEAIQYGMASNLSNFLITTDKKKYAEFINGMKEGKTWQESLKDAYRATPEQLLATYGRTIGVPELKP